MIRKFFCLVILVILMPAKVILVVLYFLPVFPQNTFSSHILLAVGHHFLRQLDLNFLNNLPLKLNFSTISLSNHSLLVFFILTVFKGAIPFTTPISL